MFDQCFYLWISSWKSYIVHTQGFHSFIRMQGFLVFSGLFSGLSFQINNFFEMNSGLVNEFAFFLLWNNGELFFFTFTTLALRQGVGPWVDYKLAFTGDPKGPFQWAICSSAIQLHTVFGHSSVCRKYDANNSVIFPPISSGYTPMGGFQNG